jgi:DNA-damage-inducible protein D
MGTTELAANLFRATQTEEKLRRENITGKAEANRVHNDMGRETRHAIERMGGTMPEDLPTPVQSIQQLQRDEAAREKRRIERERQPLLIDLPDEPDPDGED